MPDPIVEEFQGDLAKIILHLDILQGLRAFSSHSPSEENFSGATAFISDAITLQEKSGSVANIIPMANGVSILYLCGRFEDLVRALFEDLCMRLVRRANSYSNLPKKMRDNLPIYTAKVVYEPRKYGHAENGVRHFVNTLAQNLSVDAVISEVNHKCLSITEANMRADVLSELYSRIGVNNLWEQISSQTSVKVYFEDQHAKSVENMAKEKLNAVMDLRNKVAHPSGQISWPSDDAVRDYVKYFDNIGRALGEAVELYEVTLCSKNQSQA